MLPAVAQGAIGIACRENDPRFEGYLAKLNHMETHIAVNCERAFLTQLDGSCRTPIAALAVRTADGGLDFKGLLAKPDGSLLLRTARTGKWDNKEGIAIGKDAGAEVAKKAGPGFF